ncbi:MAG: serine hydrolase [Neisseria sp.]|nr:serine hydrolase [Neisseria sp.]
MHDLDDLKLVLLHDERETVAWLDNWAKLYPCSEILALNTNAQAQLQTAWQGEHKLAVVACGQAVWHLLADLYQQDFAVRKRLQALILLLPENDFPEQIAVQQFRSPCRAAVVLPADGKREAAQEWATRWQARLLFAPQNRLNEQKSWEWGKRLLQEMLLS